MLEWELEGAFPPARLRDGVTRIGSCGAFDRNEGCFHSSILSCFAMGSPCGSSVFSHSIVTKSALDSWTVFLQDGVTPVGSGPDDLISNEGIPTVGLLRAFFPARPRGVFVSSFGRPVCSEARWVPHSVVFASGEDSVCIPLTNGSSRSRTSRCGLLVYVQGASDSLPHSSPGREVVASVFGVAVRALLQATSLPLGMDVSPAPGRRLSVSTF